VAAVSAAELKQKISDAFDLPIMVPQLRDENLIASFSVSDSVLGSDSPRPKTLERMLKRLGFADPAIWISRDFFNQEVDPRNHLWIVLLPIKIILPSLRGENEIRAPNLIFRLIPLPRFKVSTAASNRFAFAGDRSR
jgi:hypothetical protein